MHQPNVVANPKAKPIIRQLIHIPEFQSPPMTNDRLPLQPDHSREDYIQLPFVNFCYQKDHHAKNNVQGSRKPLSRVAYWMILIFQNGAHYMLNKQKVEWVVVNSTIPTIQGTE
jgi:G:T-mismatch repair DNA endonuclease (very short patch repair protein)